MQKKLILFCLLMSFLSVVLAQFSHGGLEINQFLKTQVIEDDSEYIYTDTENLSLPERFRYEILNQSTELISLEPGQKKSIEVSLLNTGKSAWFLDDEAENRFILSTYVPRERQSIFLDNKIQLVIQDVLGKKVIEPDDTLVFNLDITAPMSPGFYKENFVPKITGIKTLNNELISFDFLVKGDYESSYSYELVNDNLSSVIGPGLNKEIVLELKNTGEVPWYSKGLYPIKISANGENAEMIGLSINQGESVKFKFDLNTPAQVGNYRMDFKLGADDLFVLEENPIVWEFTVSNKKVALTFDDGYGNINDFLDVLNEQDVKATFFILGCVAQNRPEEMKRIVADGHLLANHSYNHPDFRTLSASEIRWQLNTTRDIMKNITGIDPYPYFRYPYGARNDATNNILSADGWKNFHWTNGTGDFNYHENTGAGRSHITHFATLNPPDEAIVLMHVISRSTLASLPSIIEYYRNNGYAFVTVDEL